MLFPHTTTVPSWFVDQYIPKISVDAQILRLVDKPLQNIIKAINKESPTKQTRLADAAFVF